MVLYNYIGVYHQLPYPIAVFVHIMIAMTDSLAASHTHQQHNCTTHRVITCTAPLFLLTSPSFFSFLAESSSGSFT